jgi:hypothetical protein
LDILDAKDAIVRHRKGRGAEQAEEVDGEDPDLVLVLAFEQSGKSLTLILDSGNEPLTGCLKQALVITSSTVLALEQDMLKESQGVLEVMTSACLRQPVSGSLPPPSLSVTHYRVFGVKNVQFDTLSHLMVARGSTFAWRGSGSGTCTCS